MRRARVPGTSLACPSLLATAAPGMPRGFR